MPLTVRVQAEVAARMAQGLPTCNLSAIDFDDAQIGVPEALRRAAIEVMHSGPHHYAHPQGLPALREAVAAMLTRRQGLPVHADDVVVGGGARSIIFATFAAVLEPGDAVVFPTPSWNNHAFVGLCGARAIPVEGPAKRGFMPEPAAVAKSLPQARLLCLNTPLNPAGTLARPEDAEAIGRLVVQENERRAAEGRRALYVIIDQLYWTLTFGDRPHVTPLHRVPALAPWTVLVDGATKGLAATGWRVGWAVAAPALRMALLARMGLTGATAPTPLQAAVAALLAQPEAHEAALAEVARGVEIRLTRLREGLEALAAAGLPVEVTGGAGAMYLAARFDLAGRRVGARRLRDPEEVRALLLHEAGFAALPFEAFGAPGHAGWFRLAVGSVSLTDIDEGLRRLRAVLERVSE